MHVRTLAVAATTLIAMLSSAAVFAQAPAALPRAEVEGIIKDYLMKNPKIIIEAVEVYRENQEKEAKAKAEQTLKERGADLFKDPVDGSVGDASRADVNIVEFFDYHCGYCKHFLSTINQVMKEDQKVRVVLKELPILSDDSRLAAKAALAVNKIDPKKYFEYHTALMNMPKELLANGQFTEENLTAAAKKIGVNEAKFKEALKDPAFDKHIEKNLELAKALGIQGTPAVVVNQQMLPGAVAIGELKDAIQQQRTGKAPAKTNKAP